MTTSSNAPQSSYAQQIAAQAARQRAIEEQATIEDQAQGETVTSTNNMDQVNADSGSGQDTANTTPDPNEATNNTQTATDSEDEFSAEGLLSKLPGGPSLAEIQQWRAQYDSIYVLPLRDDDWYVWRYLELREWREIQSELGAVPPEDVERFIQDRVLAGCVIWPREKVLVSKQSDRTPAGLRELLYEVIMAGSYFMAPEQALQRAIRL